MPEDKPKSGEKMSPDNNQPSQPAPQPQAPTQPVAVVQQISDKADPKNRLAMMSFAFFAGPTGIARAYIGEASGVVRFWLYVGSSVLMIIPLINILAALTLSVLGVWGLVDFFLLNGKQVDANGAQLQSTNRDDRFVRYLYIAFIVLLALVAVGFIIGIIVFAIIGAAAFQLDTTQSASPSPSDIMNSFNSLD